MKLESIDFIFITNRHNRTFLYFVYIVIFRDDIIYIKSKIFQSLFLKIFLLLTYFLLFHYYLFILLTLSMEEKIYSSRPIMADINFINILFNGKIYKI